jgi:hypothetical protein
LASCRANLDRIEQSIGLNYQAQAVSFGLSTLAFKGDVERMSKDNRTYEGREPSIVFREFAAECMELAQTTPTPEKRALYLKMASVWHQMALRWEKTGDAG